MNTSIAALLGLLVLACAVHGQTSPTPYQPVIGILTQPSNDLNQDLYPSSQYQYIASSYVKWLQASGAKVIAIPFDLPEDKIDDLFSKVNGLLFPGGDASIWADEVAETGFSQMTLVGKRLLNKAIDANNNGVHFPIWGTCMGYELIVLALTDNDKALSHLNSPNHTLDTTLVNFSQSQLYSSLSRESQTAIMYQKALFYNHHYGLTVENFQSTPVLNRFFTLTSTAHDNNHTPFVSTLEGKKAPIYVSQFHSEKNSYEWLDSVHANHSHEAVKAAQEIGNFFVGQSRKNHHKFTEDEIKILNIENDKFAVVYDGFVSVYLYHNQPAAVASNNEEGSTSNFRRQTV